MHVGKLILLGLFAHLTAAADPVMSKDGAMMCKVGGSNFSYIQGRPDGPSAWSTISACCGGSRQSPRNIITSKPFSVCGNNLPYIGYRFVFPTTVTGKLFNNGNDPIVDFSGSPAALLEAAPHATGLYALSNIHIHFRTASGHGSEHAIDYKFFDAEVHLVHYKQEYGSVAEAVMHPDGLVVIALMLEVTQDFASSEIAKLIDAIQQVNGIGIAGAVSHEVDLAQLLPSSNEYYTYAGSLTTPPCSETVRWVIMRDSLRIRQQQLDILTSLKSSAGGLISDYSNDRPLQTGDTQVESNFNCGLIGGIL